jgi:RHS repeat-associated protein
VQETLYDSTGRFLIDEIDALQHKMSHDYDPVLGTRIKSTDVNNLVNIWRYDSLGREILHVAPDGVFDTTDYEFCTDDCIQTVAADQSAYYIETWQEGGTASRVYFNAIQKEILRRTQVMDGRYSYVATIYDISGRVDVVTEPYFIWPSSFTRTEAYDLLDRPTRVRNTKGGITSIAYHGFTTTRTNPKNQVESVTVDARGEKIRVKEANGKITRYITDAAGRLRTIIDAKGNRTQIEYDLLGQRRQIDDPNKGVWKYTYNGLGELVTQTDALNVTICYQYDELGRLIRRVDDFVGNEVSTCGHGESINDSRATAWSYHGASATQGARGQLDKLSSADGYHESYYYNSLGFQTSSVVQIPSQHKANGLEVLTTSQTYDHYNRVDTFTYPSGFRIRNEYNDFGFLQAVYNDRSDVYFWKAEANSVTARGQVKTVTLSSGVMAVEKVFDDDTGLTKMIKGRRSFDDNTIIDHHYEWDVIGNFNKRIRRVGHGTNAVEYIEEYGYDNLNRLTGIDNTRSGEAAIRQDMVYDDLGNFKKKIYLSSGSLYHTYSTINALSATCAGRPGAVIPGPHAVRSVTDSTEERGRYCYNANGDMIYSDWAYDFAKKTGRLISYTAFGKPATIAELDHEGAVIRDAAFYYSPDRDLIYRKDNARIPAPNLPSYVSPWDLPSNISSLWDLSVSQVTHTYILGNYEKVITGEVTKERHIIGGIVSVTVDNGDYKNPNDEYLFKDHQGSIATVTDAFGNVLQRMSYDEWGKRRKEYHHYHHQGESLTQLILSYIRVGDYSAYTGRGYTGHQMIDNVGLIHMNGRVYDPEVGRFLSADVIVQEPYNPQSLNRYAYVMNNPMSSVDPSGYKAVRLSQWWRKNKGHVRTLVSIAVAIYMPAAWGVIGVEGAAATALSAGFADIVATGGLVDPESIAVSMFSAGVANPALHRLRETAGVTTWVVGHGTLGGLRSDLTGEKFATGFVTGGLNAALSPVVASVTGENFKANAFIAGVVSGGISDAAGGSFKNGALTGAFQRLFNDFAEEFENCPSCGLDAIRNQQEEAIGDAKKAFQVLEVGAALAAPSPWGKLKALFGVGKAAKGAGKLCFVEGTLVHTQDGLKPIEEIQVGDLVKSKDEFTGKTTWKPVTELFRNDDKSILNVTLLNPKGEEELLGVTAEHPFWVEGQGWVDAGELQEGQIISSIDGDVLTVNSIVLDEQLHDTYNFEVADYHTYFVGEQGAWVHNQCNAVYKTTKEAKQAAETLGFKKINETIHDGQAVFKKGKRFITRDVDGHNGGAWKMAKSVKGLGSKDARLGTFDKDLNRIGD